MILVTATAAIARETAVTVYNHDLAVIRDRRDIEVAAGSSELRFTDVAARIDPTSVHLSGPLTVIEQNFSFDLANAEKILRRYLDRTIDVLAEEGRVYRGRLLSFDAGSLVLAGAGGSDDDITIVRRETVHDLRFPALPEGLITRPTLIWQVDAPRGGTLPLELSYMTGGMSWHAEYVAVVADDEQSMELTGWVSIENRSGATYPDAGLKLVAGDVHRAPQPAAAEKWGRGVHMMATADGAAFEERAFFEYHLYELERRTTLADQEIKQLALFETATTPVEKVFRYDAMRGGERVEVLIKAKNESAVGLGMPLPAGTVRAMKADRDGQLEFVGEDRIEHTPRGEEIEVLLGKAFDIVAERTIKDHRRISDRIREDTFEITLRNRKSEAVEILVIERPHGSWEIIESSHPHEKVEAFKIEFTVTVPADETTVIRYTTRTR
jgi:hypothetical protein